MIVRDNARVAKGEIHRGGCDTNWSAPLRLLLETRRKTNHSEIRQRTRIRALAHVRFQRSGEATNLAFGIKCADVVNGRGEVPSPSSSPPPAIRRIDRAENLRFVGEGARGSIVSLVADAGGVIAAASGGQRRQEEGGEKREEKDPHSFYCHQFEMISKDTVPPAFQSESLTSKRLSTAERRWCRRAVGGRV